MGLAETIIDRHCEITKKQALPQALTLKMSEDAWQELVTETWGLRMDFQRMVAQGLPDKMFFGMPVVIEEKRMFRWEIVRSILLPEKPDFGLWTCQVDDCIDAVAWQIQASCGYHAPLCHHHLEQLKGEIFAYSTTHRSVGSPQ